MKIANDFNLYFASLGVQNQSVIPGHTYFHDIKFNSKSIYLRPVTDSEIINIAKTFKNKQCAGEDQIPLFLLKKCISAFAKPLSNIINKSMNQGKYPDQLKVSLVLPIHKKSDKDLIQNYRPISLLSSFSKFFERVVYNRILDFFHSCNLFASFQHGFLNKKSVETAIFDYTEKILDALERRELACGLFLDLSKAFDSLDHNLLLAKLHRYGIRGVALSWCESYLEGRSQRVVLRGDIGETYSEKLSTDLGVPQGSILGPLLFIIYVNDLPVAIANPSNSMISYADDNSLLITGKTFQDVASLGDIQFMELEKWYEKNSLMLNRDKTKCLLFRTIYNKNIFPSYLNLNFQHIDITDNTKLLGIFIDSNMSWQTHIENLYKKLSSVCYALRILTKYLDFSAVKTAYYGNFYSLMKYGIIFWGQSIHFNEILKIQKKAIRIILKLGYRDSCRGIFKKYKLLTATGVYVYECILFLRKHLYLFEPNLVEHDYDTRNIELYRYPLHKLSIKEKGPFYSCLKFYNLLPKHIKGVSLFPEFKKSVFEYICDIEPYTLWEFSKLMKCR